VEVKIIPLSGCMQVVLGVFTLGVAPLAEWITQRSWPRRVDEEGLETRGGKRITWAEFTRATRVLTQVTQGSSSRVEHFELISPKGKVIVAAYRLEDGAQVMEYIWQHLPEAAKARHP
jgi:hypothetical protein